MHTRLWKYLANLTVGRTILWCYLFWYAVVLVRYFDPSPSLWLTSIGLSAIIGTALLINTTASGRQRVCLEPWPIFRLYVTPFCVSSYSALVKGRGFFLIFSPRSSDTIFALALIAAFVVLVTIARKAPPRIADAPAES